jgi:hypothetical protein
MAPKKKPAAAKKKPAAEGEVDMYEELVKIYRK